MNNKVIFTTIFEDYDNLIEPAVILNDWDYICFTESNLKSKIWEVKKINRLYNDPKKENAFYKLLPHRFLSEYEYSIYIDGNILIRGNINELINNYLINNNIAMLNHEFTKNDNRNCIYDEAKAILSANKKDFLDDPQIINNQINKYKLDKYPANNGLICGGEIIRRHNEKDVVGTMEYWWSEVKNGSRRDQLSFNYSAWKTNLSFSWINVDVRDNKYFLLKGKHKRRKLSKLISKINFIFIIIF